MKSKSSLDVVYFSLCQVFKHFQSGKFRFKMLSKFIPLRGGIQQKEKLWKNKGSGDSALAEYPRLKLQPHWQPELDSL